MTFILLKILKITKIFKYISKTLAFLKQQCYDIKDSSKSDAWLSLVANCLMILQSLKGISYYRNIIKRVLRN